MRKILLALAFSLGAVVLTVVIIGYALPRQHKVSRTVELGAPPEVVWKTVTERENCRSAARGSTTFSRAARARG